MSEEQTFPQSTWSGSFRLFGVELKCHTLSDGRRIIEADSMNALLEAMASCDVIEHQTDDTPGDFARWQAGR